MVAFFALGLMAKPMLVTLPFALLLMDYWPLGRTEAKTRLVWEKLPLFALAAASSIVTVLVQRHGGAVAGLEKVPLSVRLANAPASYLAYASKALWPVGLAAFYPLGASAPVLRALLGALFLVGATLLAIRVGRRHGYIPVGWLWYVGTLLPVIGLVQVGNQSMADRYTYVPLIGLFLIAAWGAPELVAGWRYGRVAMPAAAACVVLACAAAARAQVGYWSGSTALWQRALDVTEDNYVAHNNLGGVLVKQGNIGEAIRHFAEALRIKPDYASAQNNMGMALIFQEKFGEAAGYFGEALRNYPNYADARNNLGRALMWQGKFEEAAQQFEEALRIMPGFAAAHSNLGMVLMSQGKLDEAVPHFTEALRIDPGYAEAHDKLGSALASQGRLAEAIAEYAEAVRLSPDYVEAHSDMGVALGRQGRLDEAIQQFREALRINPGYKDASENLKLALAMQGRKE
jgi:tetratricopeptide (TPR) repeat protein